MSEDIISSYEDDSSKKLIFLESEEDEFDSEVKVVEEDTEKEASTSEDVEEFIAESQISDDS
ncbi:MAG: hypothetical protein ACK4IX_12670, partial [Candidatus Sericytochromatia bacterium]